MAYTVDIKPSFGRDFDALPPDVQVRVTRKIDALANNPRPPGVEKVKGAEELYRLRIGDYRVLYIIEDRRLIIVMVRVRHRREVYRNMR